jgi:hypothetical protein
MNEPRSTLLHHAGDAIRAAFSAVPSPVARAFFVGALVILLIWVLCLPKHRTRPREGEPGGWSANLKLWAAVALTIQITIYLIF